MELLVDNIRIILTIVSIIVSIFALLFRRFHLITKRNKQLELLLMDVQKLTENAYLLFQLYQPQIKVHQILFNQIKEKNEKAKTFKIPEKNINKIKIISIDDMIETYDKLMKNLNNNISIDDIIFRNQEWMDKYKLFREKIIQLSSS